MEMELSEMLDGRQVDLHTAGDLSRYVRDEVVRTAKVQQRYWLLPLNYAERMDQSQLSASPT